MTQEPDSTRKTLGFRFFRGRSLGPLLGPWISSAIFAGLAYYLERTMPALHDVVGPLYWMLLALVMFTTWRWFRARSRERRAHDRRQTNRVESSDIPD